METNFLQRLLGVDTPFPVANLLEKLADAADILLHEKDYDGHGREIIEHAVRAAREMAPKLREAAASPTSDPLVELLANALIAEQEFGDFATQWNDDNPEAVLITGYLIGCNEASDLRTRADNLRSVALAAYDESVKP